MSEMAPDDFKLHCNQSYGDSPEFSERFDDSLEVDATIDGQEVERQWNQAILAGDFESANRLEELRTQHL
jgi:hypothetical protein